MFDAPLVARFFAIEELRAAGLEAPTRSLDERAAEATSATTQSACGRAATYCPGVCGAGGGAGGRGSGDARFGVSGADEGHAHFVA